MGIKAYQRVYLCCVHKRSSFDDQGMMLVEVLVASMILIVVFAAVVQQVSNLATTRVRIETRDRVVTYMNSLHQEMNANGCGFDVDSVKEKVFNTPGSSSDFLGSDKQSIRAPWDRVQGCAFSANEQALLADRNTLVNAYVDDNGNVHLLKDKDVDKPIDKATASAFCKEYGDISAHSTKSCELGDQNFVHYITVNDNGVRAKLTVSVRYWFEVVGGTKGIVTSGINRSTSCSSIINSSLMPDTIARRVEVSFSNGKGSQETIVVTKRENVPVDSFQFASGTRVGVAVTSGDKATMYPVPSSDDPFMVSRYRNTPTSCIWFPFISRHEVGTTQPEFAVDSSGSRSATLTDIAPLSTGAL